MSFADFKAVDPAAAAAGRLHPRLAALLEWVRALPPIRTAIVHPCDQPSLAAAVDAARCGIIVPVLIGPERRIRDTAAAHALQLSDWEVHDTPHSHAAAACAVALARSGEVEALMKGSLHTDELLSEVVKKDSGITTARRLSHVFVMDVPRYPKLLLITDAAVNIVPTLEDKMDIAQNAIDLARVLGVARPKLAVLSAVETVTSRIRSTIDAAALCKMTDRGQITGALLDGPLALDNAISREAAAQKNIVSDVAGDADILLVPDLEAGNMLTKELTFLAGAEAAGIALGARVPLVLTSRADSVLARLASCALALLYARSGQASTPPS